MYCFCVALFVVTILVQPSQCFLMVVCVDDGYVSKYALIELESFDGEYWKFQMKSSQDVIDGEEGNISSDCSSWKNTKNMKCYLRFRPLNVDETTPLANGAKEITTTGEISDLHDEGSEGQGGLHIVIVVNNSLSVGHGSERFNGFHMLSSSYINSTILLVVDTSKQEDLQLVKLFENTISPLVQLREEDNSHDSKDVFIQSITSPLRTCQEKTFLFFKCWNIQKMKGEEYVVGSTSPEFQSTLVVSNCHIKLSYPKTTLYATGMITVIEDKGTMWIQYPCDENGSKLDMDIGNLFQELNDPEFSISQIQPQPNIANNTAVPANTSWPIIRVMKANLDPFTKKVMLDFDFGDFVFLCFWNGVKVKITKAYHDAKAELLTVFDETVEVYRDAVSSGFNPAEFKVKIASSREAFSKAEVTSKGLSIELKNYGNSQNDNVLKHQFAQFHHYNTIILGSIGNVLSSYYEKILKSWKNFVQYN